MTKYAGDEMLRRKVIPLAFAVYISLCTGGCFRDIGDSERPYVERSIYSPVRDEVRPAVGEKKSERIIQITPRKQ